MIRDSVLPKIYRIKLAASVPATAGASCQVGRVSTSAPVITGKGWTGRPKLAGL
jgi:hypothetical protein